MSVLSPIARRHRATLPKAGAFEIMLSEVRYEQW
jgi:hypothetical protein